MMSSSGFAVAALSVFVICASCLVTTKEGFRLKDYIPSVGMIVSWQACKKKNKFVECSNAAKKMWEIRETNNRRELPRMFEQVAFAASMGIYTTLIDVLNGDDRAIKEIGPQGVDAFSKFVNSLPETDRKKLLKTAARAKQFQSYSGSHLK